FSSPSLYNSLFSFNAPAPPAIYTLSLHDALPISWAIGSQICPPDLTALQLWSSRLSVVSHSARPASVRVSSSRMTFDKRARSQRSEEHTSELQSPYDLVCRLLLEKKNNTKHL